MMQPQSLSITWQGLRVPSFSYMPKIAYSADGPLELLSRSCIIPFQRASIYLQSIQGHAYIVRVLYPQRSNNRQAVQIDVAVFGCPRYPFTRGRSYLFEDLRASGTSTCPSSPQGFVLLDGYLNSKRAQQKQGMLLRLTVSSKQMVCHQGS